MLAGKVGPAPDSAARNGDAPRLAPGFIGAPRLVHRYLEPALGELVGRSEAGDAAPEDGHRGWGGQGFAPGRLPEANR
ncbi:hypothetical protein LBMAG42_38170 [Deltaproteobacteria bacterium]|nr:hypothetical protein LBMAG42_38170 [Deltaproteobacteria bacterium]